MTDDPSEAHRPSAPPSEGRTLSPVELRRLRWRCRRGMLENDLILARFLEERGSRLTAGDAAALDRLLRLADNALWDLLAGRAEPDDPAVGPLLGALRRI